MDNISIMELLKNTQMISLSDASLLTNQSVQTLYSRIAEKRLKAIQYTKRGKWYINSNDLREYMEA